MQTRSLIARLIDSKTALVGLTAGVILAVAGTTYGYTSLSNTVTLSLDGQEREVTAMGGTVGEVLESEGIEVTDKDKVFPSVDEAVSDGSAISVRFGRPVELTVDGETETHWVTATDVGSALVQIGDRFAGADLSVSRGGSIDREGLELEVVTPKKLTFKIAGKKPVTRSVPALTAREALDELGVKVDKHDQIKPGKKAEVEDGDTVVFTDIRVVTKRVKNEAIDFSTIERADDSMLEGETSVVRSGDEGLRNVTYRITYRNGELVARKVLQQKVLDEPRDALVKVGTKEEPTPAANYASGGTVWDALAQCESGGNWAINTGNGYYGGLQFSLGTWQSYGGPGMPHQQSRETQIAIAEKVRAATGGYGSWPHCSQSLGLPQ
ncbi:transglycosylase family protein [Nocardioides sp.]|uniref:transglycosylase family protein n=1 Tax=Nocardioides sp. TaxID=35761 RepID=UPI002ED3142D